MTLKEIYMKQKKFGPFIRNKWGFTCLIHESRTTLQNLPCTCNAILPFKKEKELVCSPVEQELCHFSGNRLKLLKPRSCTSSKVSSCMGFAWPDSGGQGVQGWLLWEAWWSQDQPAPSGTCYWPSGTGVAPQGNRVRRVRKKTAQLQPEKGGRPRQKNFYWS